MKSHTPKAPSNLSVVGRYILNSKIFENLTIKRKVMVDEIQLTDSLVSLIEKPGLFGVEFEGKDLIVEVNLVL